METKLFELRDHGTFIPLLCIKPSDTNGTAFEAKMAWRYGYKNSRAVIVTHLSVPQRGCKNDWSEWGDRTYAVAHKHIEENWDTLKTGDLIDVRVLLGEAEKPCESEA